MREETARWLEPLLEEADRRDMDIKPLMQRAIMPVSEAAGPYFNWLVEVEREQGVAGGAYAIDWIRFGQVLASELGWIDYPREPDEDPGCCCCRGSGG